MARLWHPRYEVLDIMWTEVKLLEQYSMPMVPHKYHYFMDFYHGLGCFWFVKKGLFHSGVDHEVIATFLFLGLHSMNDSAVSKKDTQVIRENLPRGCPTDIANTYCAKSTRRGSITELATHQGELPRSCVPKVANRYVLLSIRTLPI